MKRYILSYWVKLVGEAWLKIERVLSEDKVGEVEGGELKVDFPKGMADYIKMDSITIKEVRNDDIGTS